MKTIVPRNLTHRGTIQAEAFLLPAKIIGETEMRRRVLRLWQSGVQVVRRENDLIVLLPEAQRIDSRRSPGLPFVRYGKILSAFPLDKKDLATFPDLSESLIFLVEGNIETVRLHELRPERIENWFDTSDFRVIQTETLGETAIAPQLMKAIAEENINLRSELKSVPQADSQLAEILAKLKEVKAASANKPSGSLFNTTSSSSGNSYELPNFLSSMFTSLKNLFASTETSFGGKAGYTKTGANDIPNFEPFEPGAFSKIYNRLRHLTVKAVVEMRMARIFGR